MWYMHVLERDILPDWLLRAGIRRRMVATINQLNQPDIETRGTVKQALIQKFRSGPIAVHTDAANEQHYELPAEFFEIVLGSRLKYSSCYWPDGVTSLDEAEETMLQLYAERAQLQNGLTVLELGCGWGSLSLWLAERYPRSEIVAVSNSSGQRVFIMRRAQERGIDNLRVITADMVDFDIDRQFDCVISIEMFEHMKNYEKLLGKIARWLKPGGFLFVHHFSHREHVYEFDHSDHDNFLARYFFTGGTMPSDDLLLYFQRDLRVVSHWRVDGRHYERTLNTWLVRMDANRARVFPVIEKTYGAQQAMQWWVYWRLFFMSCAEAFGLRGGTEFFVTHVLMEKPEV